MTSGPSGWSDEVVNSNSDPRRPGTRQTMPGTSSRTTSSHMDELKSTSSATCKGGFRLGIYGWRKKCLYSLMLSLMIIVILNLALTVWLLKVMGFSSEGIGSLKVVPGGIELRGQATILDTLVASSLSSREGKNLVLESWSNFTASARTHDGHLLARFTIGEDRVNCVSGGFRITDPGGGVLFSADKEQVVVGAQTLRVTGDGGAVFHGSVQTPLVRGELDRDLRLESGTRSLTIKAPQRVVLESWAGEMTATCLTDMKLESVEGSISLDAKSVFLKGLKTATPVQGHSSREQQQAQQQHSSRSPNRQSQAETTVYQLCVCANGKLFLAKSDGICQADKTVC